MDDMFTLLFNIVGYQLNSKLQHAKPIPAANAIILGPCPCFLAGREYLLLSRKDVGRLSVHPLEVT